MANRVGEIDGIYMFFRSPDASSTTAARASVVDSPKPSNALKRGSRTSMDHTESIGMTERCAGG